MMGSQDVPEGKDASDILKQAAKAGITAFEYRERGQDQLFGTDKIDLGTKLRKICQQHDIPFIVDNDIEMVKLLDADGIHVEQESEIDLKKLREQFPNKLIGLTIKSQKQQDGGQFAPADFVLAGPIYKNLPHSNAEKPAEKSRELDFIKQLSSTYPTIQVAAFGGVDETNANEVLTEGASGVAVISAITEAGESIHDVIAAL